MQEWRTFRVWDLKPVEYDQEGWTKLIMDESTKVRVTMHLTSFNCKLNHYYLWQDLIRALVDTTGHSVGTPQPAQFSKGKVCLEARSLLASR